MQSLFTTPAASQLLTEKYRPHTITDFVGLTKAKKVCSNLIARPMESSLIFKGDPGLGKTTLALALAEQMPAELHHIPSQSCNLETLKKVVDSCHYVPRIGFKMHVVLIDEADQMSSAAQLYLLSKMDSTGRPPNTIFVFTCNTTETLQERFLSRCFVVEFSNYGNAPDASTLLSLVWDEESNGAPAPNFQRIVKESNGNIRTALMRLQQEIMYA